METEIKRKRERNIKVRITKKYSLKTVQGIKNYPVSVNKAIG